MKREVTFVMSEAKMNKGLSQLLVPRPMGLFEYI